MAFEDALTLLAGKVAEQWEKIETEEATKTAFILPFISTVLGYDIFNPLEVVPEYTADVGVKRGEKVDYAIIDGGEVRILVECKKVTGDLTTEHAAQLYRYFSVTKARIAILTNGRVYNFYTDLDASNVMDSRPFLVLDLADIDETFLPELRKLTKERFDLDSIVSAAEELKYLGAIKREVAAEFKEPSSEFVKLFASRVYDGRVTQQVLEKFTIITDKALRQFLNERINDRLKSALGADANTVMPVPDNADDTEDDVTTEAPMDGIETTEEELAAYRIVKAIACAELPAERITYRDVRSYFSVLVDDNNRRPIVRCYFNTRTKYIGFIDENKREQRHAINALEDLYTYVDDIRAAARRWA